MNAESADLIAALNARKFILRWLRHRTRQDWQADIKALPFGRRVRAQVACIVWWDYFARHQKPRGWLEIDQFRNAWRRDRNADADSVELALVSLGWDTGMAAERVKAYREYAKQGTP